MRSGGHFKKMAAKIKGESLIPRFGFDDNVFQRNEMSIADLKFAVDLMEMIGGGRRRRGRRGSLSSHYNGGKLVEAPMSRRVKGECGFVQMQTKTSFDILILFESHPSHFSECEIFGRKSDPVSHFIFLRNEPHEFQEKKT